MVEPMFRFDGELAAEAIVELGGEEGHHAVSVRRLRSGEAIALTDGRGTLARGMVLGVASKSLTAHITEIILVSKSKLQFGLVQALAKGDRDELAIQAATELGVAEVIPWQAERSVSIWSAEKQAKNLARWQSICDEASKQSLRSWFVAVSPMVNTKMLAAQVVSSTEMWLVLDPTAIDSIAEVELPDSGQVNLVVGPEGGISSSELEILEQAGARRVHLGKGILRTSTAPVAALAYLAGKTGQWA